MKQLFKNVDFRIWLAIVGSATLVLGAAYVMVQQSTRLSANDLPIAKAQQVKQLLEIGATPADVVPAMKINLQNDNNIFMIITDKQQDALGSSAVLAGKTPLPPAGVFEYTKAHGTDTLTWQPAANVRIASYITSYKDGFIITGQSLKPFEERIGAYNLIALIAWLGVLLWSTTMCFFWNKLR